MNDFGVDSRRRKTFHSGAVDDNTLMVATSGTAVKGTSADRRGTRHGGARRVRGPPSSALYR